MTYETSRTRTKTGLLVALILVSTIGASTAAASETMKWATHAVAATQFMTNPDNNPSWDPINGPWSAAQATGVPDTYPRCVDRETAWAPATPLETPETLALAYDPPVESPTRLDIYETYSFWLTGFVQKVDLVTTTGVKTVFDGDDHTPCPGILAIPLTNVGTVVGVVIHTQTLGYEEIDAVGLATAGTA